ncbi:MAG: hypothetical protein COA58_01155 [Bacteroidetes bacterium]|nr:MAG: hypothetical protein COA58_01155 [Bacteroidota bacterium]
MKQLIAILLLSVFTWVGTTNMTHQYLEQDRHCSSEEEHICSPEGHHHCSLCDTLINYGFTTEAIEIETSTHFEQRNSLTGNTDSLSSINLTIQDRGPPLV